LGGSGGVDDGGVEQVSDKKWELQLGLWRWMLKIHTMYEYSRSTIPVEYTLLDRILGEEVIL
jgi:hypothetical protein